MGTYWWVVNRTRRERIDPSTLDCGIKHLDRPEYWEHRNEFARCVEWLLVTNQWRPEDVYLVSDANDVVAVSSYDYGSPPTRPDATGSPTESFVAETRRFPDISASVRDQKAKQPLPIPTRATLVCARELEVTTLFDDRGAVIRRRSTRGPFGPPVESHAFRLGGVALRGYAAIAREFWFYDGVGHWLRERGSPSYCVTIAVEANRWSALITGIDGEAIATQSGEDAPQIGDLTMLRCALPASAHGLVPEIEIALDDGFPRMKAAFREALELRGEALAAALDDRG